MREIKIGKNCHEINDKAIHCYHITLTIFYTFLTMMAIIQGTKANYIIAQTTFADGADEPEDEEENNEDDEEDNNDGK